jgi:predicted RNA-binding Zn ribbon-like protein
MTDRVRTREALELVGGMLCLDFINTINSRVEPEHDYLLQYTDVVGWASKVGILSPAQSNQLQKRAKRDAEKAEYALQRVRTIRELLYRLFSNAAKGSDPEKKDMDSFVKFYGESITEGQFFKTDNHYVTAWKVDQGPAALLFPIIHSAGELLQSEYLVHVKECPGCGWLFLDTSKNQSRRWCSMNTCGARDKMRRYHKRQRTS